MKKMQVRGKFNRTFPWALIIGMVFLAASMSLWVSWTFGQNDSFMVVISEQKTGQVLYENAVKKNDQIEFHWMHSVENSPWEEIFTVENDGKLKLREMRFRTFGAGMPYFEEGEQKTENGFMIMSGMDKTFDSYDWIHSQSATIKIVVEGEILLRGEDVEHHIPLRMKVEEVE